MSSVIATTLWVKIPQGDLCVFVDNYFFVRRSLEKLLDRCAFVCSSFWFCMLFVVSVFFFLLHNTFFFPKEPLYYWQQTEDDLTVTIQLPEDCTKEDIQVQFLPDSVNIVLKGQRFLEGNLFSSIDHESSTWIIKENNRYFFFSFIYIWNFTFYYFTFFFFLSFLQWLHQGGIGFYRYCWLFFLG